jgi:hypothetical protein
MKSDQLKEALRLIAKVQADPRMGPDQGEQLRRAKRELVAVGRSGKLDRDLLFRAVARLATVMQEIVEDDAFQRSQI